VNAKDGLDEISNGSVTTVAELRDGEINWFEIDPREYGFDLQPTSSIVARDASHSLDTISKVFNNEPGPAHDIVALNGGAAIYICGLASTLADGIVRAKELLADGSVGARFERFIKFTQQHRRRP
jgi:anthranilate phosphoribosyltransferase